MIGKFLSVLAAIAGVVAIVLPFLTVSIDDVEGVDGSLEFSLIALVQTESAEEFIEKGAAQKMHADIDNEDERAEKVAEFEAKFEEKYNQWKTYGYVLFAPIALIILGALGSLFMGHGRGVGFLLLLGAIVGGGIYYLFDYAIQEKPEELGSIALNMMIGFTVYVAAAGVAGLAGLLGVVAPEKKKGDDKKKKKK